MALNFPITPAVGQVFQSEGATFVWTGEVWVPLNPTNFLYATNAEGLAGTLADRAMSPLRLRGAIDARGYQSSNLWSPPVLVTDAAVLTNRPNTTGRAIMVTVDVNGPAGDCHLRCWPTARGGSTAADAVVLMTIGSGRQPASGCIIVPPAWSLRVSTPSTFSILRLWEYR